MPSRKHWTVGAFVLGGLALFATALFFIGDRRNLFSQNFEAIAEFKTVSGLITGAPVRVAGFNAGEVVSIAIPEAPDRPFRVRLRLREDLHQLVRTDSVATIETDGLIGNKIVQVEGGTGSAAEVADGGRIDSREPLDVEELVQRVSGTIDQVGATIEQVSTTVEQVRGDLDEALGAVTTLANDAGGIVTDVGAQVRTIATHGRRISADLDSVLEGIRQGRGTVGRLVNDDTLYKQAARIAADVETSMQNVRETTRQVRTLVADINQPGGPAAGVTADLRRTMGRAEDAVTNLAESTEALKRNFLVRGYFNRRGFFDLGSMTPAQYRGGQLENGGRRPLRLWLRDDVLFAEGPEGRELTEAGRARLDSAMSEILKYSARTPVVVEGYAAGVTLEEQYRRSRARAIPVRDYLVARYGRDPALTAAMALGAEALGDPPGEGARWDGVAITSYVLFEDP